MDTSRIPPKFQDSRIIPKWQPDYKTVLGISARCRYLLTDLHLLEVCKELSSDVQFRLILLASLLLRGAVACSCHAHLILLSTVVGK
jgi:hypothetical protein